VRGTRSPRTRFAPVHYARREHEKPLRDLLVNLPYLQTSASGGLNMLGSSQTVVLQIAEQAEACAQALSLGIAAVGTLIPFAAPEIEDGTVPMGTVEAVGWLLSELGEVAAACTVLAAECRQARSIPGGEQP
jgi:hypothetical protein